MGRGRKRLSHEQSALLKRVAEADDAWRRAKKYEYEKARSEAEDRIAQYSLVRDQAVYDAVQAGVPKVVIGNDGLGTSNPYAVTQAYNRIAEMQSKSGVELPQPLTSRFSWGRVIAFNERWIYGWVLDTENPDIKTSAPLEIDSVPSDGYFVTVDLLNGVTTTIHSGKGILTIADEGLEEVREWAETHNPE